MKCRELCNILEQHIPVSRACDWDNVGLLVGHMDKEIKKIYIAVDATDEVINKAQLSEADMILVHHPLIFSPLKAVTSEQFISNRVVDIIRGDMNLYAMHTNYDVVRMADVVSDRLALTSQRPLELTSVDTGEGLGKIGDLPKAMTLKEIATYVKDRFGLPGVQVFPAVSEMKNGINAREEVSAELNSNTINDKTYSTIAVLPGSGKSAIETVVAMGIEVYITGDIGHHEGIDSASRGMSIIDAGHYGLEHVFIEDMKAIIEDLLPTVEVLTEDVKHPYYIV